MKSKLRRVTINDEIYLWRREHLHINEYQFSECVEKVVIYLNGCKNSPLQLIFKEEDNLHIFTNIERQKWCVGQPDEGIIWLYQYRPPLENNEPYPTDEQPISINLNLPSVITHLIKHFLLNDWKPKENRKPLIIENGLEFLETIFPQKAKE